MVLRKAQRDTQRTRADVFLELSRNPREAAARTTLAMAGVFRFSQLTRSHEELGFMRGQAGRRSPAWQGPRSPAGTKSQTHCCLMPGRHGPRRKGGARMFRSVFVRLTAVAGLMGLASFGLLGAAPSTFAAGRAGSLDPTVGKGGEGVT